MIQKRNDDLEPFFYDGFMSTYVVILWNRLRFRLNEHMFVSFVVAMPAAKFTMHKSKLRK